MAKRCARLEFSACALTDHGNISCMVDHFKAMRKEGVRPIAGIEFYVCKHSPGVEAEALARGERSIRQDNGRPFHHLVVLAKNLNGWRQLMKAVSLSNTREHFYYSPRLSLDNLSEFARGGDLVAFSGHPGSELANCLFTSAKLAYACKDEESALKYAHPDWPKRLVRACERYLAAFGRGNFFIEVQVLNPEGMPACLLIAKAMRWVSKKLKIPALATADSHYVEEVDAIDQQTLLCARLKKSLRSVRDAIDREEDVELGGFFRGSHYFILSEEEMLRNHTAREVAMAGEVAAMCEDYDILAQPRLPNFPCPGDLDERGYLRALCEEGFRSKVRGRAGYDEEVYRARLERELGVIEGAGLEAYFLIVRECMNYGRERGWLLGPARGSSAGCLVSWLVGVTSIDPIPYGLMFERFYNEGRNKPGHISLPDVDMDFPAVKRDDVFRMLQNKFGHDKVSQISTFQTMQGRSALDAVLSAHEVSFDERKLITQAIPDKAKIQEELQEMVERGEEPSIIRYSLETFGDELAEWVRLNDDGTLSGDFAPYFAQAMRLEGTKKNLSRHAAGVIVSPVPLSDVCPMRYEKTIDAYIAAMEYPALEAMGLVKLDLLSINMLNKGEGVRSLALTGKIADDS